MTDLIARLNKCANLNEDNTSQSLVVAGEWMEIAALLREAATALAARTEGPTEEEVIAGVVSHWFTQGGKAQFGMIPPCQNADEVVSEILERVRNPKPDSCAVPSATERGKDQA